MPRKVRTKRRFHQQVVVSASVLLMLSCLGCEVYKKAMVIESIPPSARIYVNDEYLGEAPCTYTAIDDPWGREDYSIVAKLDGYEPAIKFLRDRSGTSWIPEKVTLRLEGKDEERETAPTTAGVDTSDVARKVGLHSAPRLPATIRNTYVLVIGIDQYRDPNIPALNYTQPDAKAVYEFFKSSPMSPARPSNVHYVGVQPNQDGLAATERGIKKAVSKYLVNKAVRHDDMAILYFAGHGDVGKHPTEGTEYYLIPADAERSDLFNTAIELSEFQRLWSAIRAETKILIADACNSGGLHGHPRRRRRNGLGGGWQRQDCLFGLQGGSEIA